ERQLDDEDGLHQGDRPGGQRDGLADRGQQDHADAGQPHLVLEQVGEQGQGQGLGRRGGRGGHPLEDRRQTVEQRRKQREQNRHHRGILAAWLADVAAALGHGEDQAALAEQTQRVQYRYR